MELLKSDLSQTISVMGQPVNFANWMDPVGPNGGRQVIDYFNIYVTGSFTVAAATWAGEDVARICANIRVEQHDSVVRQALGGDRSRIWTYACLGAPAVFEHADVGVGAAAPISYVWQVCMRKPKMHTPGDFSLPVEEFKRIVLDVNTLGDAGSAATLTVPSLTFYVIAHVREEFDVRIKCTDEVNLEDFKSTTQGMFTIGGRPQDLIVHVRGADGGASLAGLTDVRIDTINFPTLLKNPDLLTSYRIKRDAGNNLSTTQAAQLRSDPFVFPAATEKAVAVLLHDAETSAWSGRVVPNQMKVDMTNTVASPGAIIRRVVPTSQQARNRTLSIYKLSPDQLRVATDAKSSRDIKDWPVGIRPYLPLKGDLPKDR